jgi:hypothetical protein
MNGTTTKVSSTMTYGSEDHTSNGEVFLKASDPEDSTAADASARTVDLILYSLSSVVQREQTPWTGNRRNETGSTRVPHSESFVVYSGFADPEMTTHFRSTTSYSHQHHYYYYTHTSLPPSSLHHHPPLWSLLITAEKQRIRY